MKKLNRVWDPQEISIIDLDERCWNHDDEVCIVVEF